MSVYLSYTVKLPISGYLVVDVDAKDKTQAKNIAETFVKQEVFPDNELTFIPDNSAMNRQPVEVTLTSEVDE